MRLPVAVATFAVSADLLYRYVNGNSVDAKQTIAWGVIISLLSVVSLTEFASIADMFSYIVILIIALNDGYDFLRSI